MVTFFAKTAGTGDASDGCGVSWGEIVGTGDLGTAGGVALRGVASFRSLAADGKGEVACAGASLAGVSRGVGTGGVA